MGNDTAHGGTNESVSHSELQDVRCGHCDFILGRVPRTKAVITQFPRDLPGSLAMLTGGIGSVICPHCHMGVDTDAAHVVLLDNDVAVVGLPLDWSPEVCEQAVAQLATQLPRVTWRFYKGRQAFRTAVIQQGLQAPMELMRAYDLADSPLQWVAENAKRLDSSFFSTLWLVGTGAVKTFLRPIGQSDDLPVFVPKDAAPDEARHVVRTAEAATHMRERTGGLIGRLMTHCVKRAIEERSLDAIFSSLQAAIPGALVRGSETLAALADHVDRVTDGIEQGREGWILQIYLHEAALAALCSANNVENPRSDKWTFWYLVYDMHRRLDGNDESVLPSIDALNQTLNPASFWRHFHGLFRNVLSSSREDDPEVCRARLLALMDSASRVFPNELPSQVEHFLSTPVETQLDEAGLQALIRDAIRLPLRSVTLRRCLDHLCKQPSIDVAALLLQALEDPRVPLANRDRIDILRFGMEYLKDYGRAIEAAQLASAGEAIVVAEAGGGDIEPKPLGYFMNEVGNVLRLLSRAGDAVEAYRRSLELIGGGLDDSDYRIAQRNLGIVLRELHRYSEALPIFQSLREKARPLEMRGLVTSEALCLLEIGQAPEAQALMRRYLDHVEGAPVDQAGVIEFCGLYAALLAEAGEIDAAVKLLAPVREAARERNHQATLMTARDLDLRCSRLIEERRSLIDAQVEVFRHFGEKPAGTLQLRAIDHVVDSLIDLGETERAERLLRDLARATNPSFCPRGWHLYVRSGALAKQRGDVAQCADDIDVALAYLHAGVTTAVSSGDLHHFTAPDASLLDRLVADALECHSGDESRDQWRWRNAADALAAPALTARLRMSAGIPQMQDTPTDENQRLTEWLRMSGDAVVQFCSADRQVVGLKTTLNPSGHLLTTLHRLPITTEVALDLARKLPFRLLRADPEVAELPLQSLSNWPEVLHALDETLAGLQVDRQLLVIAGPLQEAVISLAVGGRYPLCFAPSLRAAVALNARVPSVPPEHNEIFGFAAWLDRERADSAAALASVPNSLSRITDSHGWVERHAAGPDATREALLKGLTHASAAWIACHGRMGRKDAAIDLLVAAGGRLPPANLRDAADPLRDAHTVRWEDLAALGRTPEVVFSSACDSGVVHTNMAGERLGLERALLPAGTAQFVAPLWPVPTVAIQQVVARLIDLWLSEPSIPLAVHLMRTRQWCMNEGVSPLAGQALALFGLSSRK